MQKQKFVEHLSRILIKIQDDEEKENSNSNSLEQISYLIKKQKNEFGSIPISIKEKKTAQILSYNSINSYQNLKDDNDQILKLMGKSLTDLEIRGLQAALNYHEEQFQKPFIFFGKIFGIENDYFIIYTQNLEVKKDILGKIIQEKDDLPDYIERKGINQFEFYVSNTNLLQWNKLPIITPQQLRLCRERKIYLSGNLENDFQQYNYPGQEQHFLKSILVRILCSTFLYPSQILQLNEDENIIEINKEFLKEFFLSKEDAQSRDNWIHRYPYILNCGRMEHFIPKHRTEEEGEELKDQLNENDPMVDQLRMISEDKENLWDFKYYGEKDIYEEMKGEDKNENQVGCVCIQNNEWPGALNFFSLDKQRHFFIYFGFGHKKQFILLKDKITQKQIEIKQRREQKEPNHYELPKEEEEDQEQNEEKDQESNNENEQEQQENENQDQEEQNEDDQNEN